jgi:hypothetical protein
MSMLFERQHGSRRLRRESMRSSVLVACKRNKKGDKA